MALGPFHISFQYCGKPAKILGSRHFIQSVKQVFSTSPSNIVENLQKFSATWHLIQSVKQVVKHWNFKS